MKLADILLAIAVPIIWGSGFVLAKIALADFPPILLMAMRYLVTVLALIWFFRPPMAVMKQLFFIALISATIQYALTFNGLQRLDASTAGLLIQVETPFCVILAYFVLKERLSKRMIIALLIAMMGVAIIAGEPKLEGNTTGVLLILGGGIAWATGQIMVRQLGQIGGFVLITWVAAIATPQMFLASWIFEDGQLEAIINAGWQVWFAIIYMGLIMTALGYSIWYRLLGQYPVNNVAPFLLLLPIVVTVESVLFLGERLTVMISLGGALTLFGVALLVFGKQKNVEIEEKTP